MRKQLVFLLLLLCGTTGSSAQDANSISQGHEANGSLQQNKHMVFARTPISSNNPGNATQSFNGDEFIYARVFFAKPIKDVLFLEKNEEGVIPVDVFIEDLSNHSSLYISFDLFEAELTKTFFDFDVLPDPAHTLRNSKEFDTGRFSYFVSESGLENRHPVFKLTIGDATGYILVDFSKTNLQQVRARDFQAYQNAHKVKEGEEK